MSLFFNLQLGFDPNTSTALFHTYEFFVFSFTIVGAIIADNWLGLFKTIVSMSLVYSTGLALVSVGTISPLNLPIEYIDFRTRVALDLM
jgi:solute carrier family 15 (oligopeptide transporter), member 1